MCSLAHQKPRPPLKKGNVVRMVLIVAGFIWFGLAVVFVLGLMCVAGRPMPAAPEHATRRRLKRDNSLTKNPTPSNEEAAVTQPALDI